jgi:hypothetical protein
MKSRYYVLRKSDVKMALTGYNHLAFLRAVGLVTKYRKKHHKPHVSYLVVSSEDERYQEVAALLEREA